MKGVKEKYPEEILLKGRLPVEGNVIGCLFQDPLLLDEITCTEKDFITRDGRFYYKLIKALHQKKINEITEVDIQVLSEDIYNKFQELGGWESIEQLKEVVNLKNFDSYIDTLYRETIILKLYSDGFNLTKEIETDSGKKVTPISLMRRMTSEECLDWWESRLTTYGNGFSNKILEEEMVDFDDDFIASCENGEETGVPFDTAGIDINGEDINCFPFLSWQVNGLLPGTLSMIGGFSSTGKSTWLITLIMALISRDQKVIVISNEESIKKYKIKFLVWMLAKRNRYFKLTKKKLTNGELTEEDKKQLKDVMQYWKENYKGKIKLISINDADMTIVKKKIREAALREGFSCFVYDTFKLQEQNFGDNRTDLSLVHDSRELHKLAMKYNMIGLASIQLAEYMRGTLFISANSISAAKQVKEILENLWLMRNLYPNEELDPKSKFYCKPYRLTKLEDEVIDKDGNARKVIKWVEKPFEPDPSATWKILFVEKSRGGANSSDNGSAYLLKYDGDHSLFREQCQCRPKHGRIE